MGHRESIQVPEPPINREHPHPQAIPSQLTPLIGRAHDVAAILHLLAQPRVRLLTLIGPGGVGKTRLSLQVAHELSTSFRDGVCLVPLAAVRDPGVVLSSLAQAAGLRETNGPSLLAQLQTQLRDRELLLVLDNFEQVVEAAPLLTQVLAACPHLKALVTSRTVLRVAGEQPFSVAPLALPTVELAVELAPDLEALAQVPAVHLFLPRAHTVKPDLALTTENAAAMAAICTRLDGLPLALELAAVRLKLLSPQALLNRLNHRLTLLTEGARDLPVHQQTLRRTIDWSYDLLNPAEQRLFMQLAVFAGSWTLEAAEAVCLLEPSEPWATPGVLDGMASLLDQSLLLQTMDSDGETRFSMLETIREYALERLHTSGTAQTLAHRHATYYVALAELAGPHLTGPAQARWLDRLEQDHDNLRAALQWALSHDAVELAVRLVAALWRFWHVHSHLSEGRHWIEVVVAQSATIRSEARAEALCGAAWLANLHGEIAQAEQFFTASLELSQELGHRHGIGMAMSGIGRLAHLRGDLEQATSLYETGLALFRELGERDEIAWSLTRLGILALEQHNYARASGLLEESSAYFRASGFTWGLTWSLIYQGHVALEQGDVMRATALYDAGVSQFQALGDKGSLATSLTYLGRAALSQGNIEHATARYQESVALYQSIGVEPSLAECLEQMAVAVWGRSAAAWAVRLLSMAAVLRISLGTPLPPADQSRYAQLLQEARALLGEASYFAAWHEGQSMTPEQAVVARPSDFAAPPPTPKSAGLVTPTVSVPKPASDPDIFKLTTRELDVLRLVTLGLTDAEVARQLCVSPRTVNSHLRSIYSKLGVSTRSAATRLALDTRLV